MNQLSSGTIQTIGYYSTLGQVIGTGAFLATKLMYPTTRKDGSSTWKFFSDKEMRLLFASIAFQPFLVLMFWDNLIIENDAFWKKDSKKFILFNGVLYTVCLLNPKKFKYIVAFLAFWKLVGFSNWFNEPKQERFANGQNVGLFGDITGSIAYAMAFYQLYNEK